MPHKLPQNAKNGANVPQPFYKVYQLYLNLINVPNLIKIKVNFTLQPLMDINEKS